MSEQLTADLGGKILTRTAVFENLKPDTNLLKVPTLILDVKVQSIDEDELVLEGLTYSPNVPENILPQQYKIPLPLNEDNTIEIELLPVMKFQYRKAKSIAKAFPIIELEIISVTNDSITAKVLKEAETWGFGIDAHRNTLIIDNDGHEIYNVPGYKIEVQK